MIQTQYLDLQAFFREKIKSPEDYKKVISVAVGVAISKLIPLPSAGLKDAAYEFDTVLTHSVNSYATTFNENIVINLDLTKETARGYWLVRHSAAYPDLNVPALPTAKGCFTEKLFNVPTFVNSETLAYLDQHNEVFVVLVNRIVSVLKTIDTNHL